MQIATSNEQLAEILESLCIADKTLGFVPTMGNLHLGHLKLVEVAKQQADQIAVSIFVNPMQFNQSNDFSNYPRTLETDIEKLEPLGVDVLYCPENKDIYPEGLENATKVIVPGLSEIMCGQFRPGHFEGVTTVVAKLFNLVQPDVAVFGEKDFQQLQVIRKMVEDLNFPVNILGVETEREQSGLALSSRNQYLSDDEKQNASGLYQVLSGVAREVLTRCQDKTSEREDFHDFEQNALQQLTQAGFKPEYIEVRSARDLQIGNSSMNDLRVFAAAWLGQARLIDNLPVKQ